MASRTPTEEELHYTSLINLFKFALGGAGVVAVILGFLIYSNGKEMRDDFREQRKDMKDEIAEMKSELNEAKLGMKMEAKELIKETQESVAQTKLEALNQISGVKENSTLIAQAQAKKSINAVFDAKNLDQFIVDVAKERIEPKVKSLVDNRFAEMQAKRKKHIVEDLANKDKSVISRGLTELKSYPDLDFSDSEIELIFQKVYSTKDDMLRYALQQLFLHRPSTIVTKYYLQDAKSNFALNDAAFEYFMIHPNVRKHLGEVSLLLLRNIDGKSTSIINAYNDFIWNALNKNKEAAIVLLNDKELVDYVYAHSTEAQIKSSKESIKISEAEYRNGINLKEQRYFLRQ